MNLKFLTLIYVFTSIINNDTYNWKHTMFYLSMLIFSPKIYDLFHRKGIV